MNVNFDGLRTNGVNAYNSLIKTLNESIDIENQFSNLEPNDIDNQLHNLRNFFLTLVYLYGEEKNIRELDLKLDIFDK